MSVMTCAREQPMPKDRDQVGQHWVHVDAAPVAIPLQDGETTRVHAIQGTLHQCPHCKHEFYQLTREDIEQETRWRRGQRLWGGFGDAR